MVILEFQLHLSIGRIIATKHVIHFQRTQLYRQKDLGFDFPTFENRPHQCLDVTTQPKEPELCAESFLAIYAANCNHRHYYWSFLYLNVICSHFVSMKRGKFEFFQNSLEIQNLPYKYFDSIMLMIKKPGHCCPLLEITFLY